MRIGNAVTCVAVCLASGVCFAQESPTGLPFVSKSKTSFTWMMTDGGGSRWDIQYNGTVSDGTNDAYDGGVALTIAGSTFSWGSEGLLSADRREAQVGPWTNGSLKVWRRVFVSPKGSYCRWIDIFENTGTSNQTYKVRYQTFVGGGVQVIQTAAGKEQVGEKDWGFLTGDGQQGSSRPALAHIFADRGSKVRAKIQVNRGNNQVFYDFDVPVPAGKTAALCLFESQQRGVEAAQEFLKKFRPAAELASVPAELRKIILNMGGAFFSAGSLEMPRNETLDLAVLREGGNELLGTIQDANFAVETLFGRLDLPAERVVGLAAPQDTDSYVQIALTDGQIVAGKLLSDPVKLKLESGSEMALPVAKLSTLAFRVSAQKPAEVNLTHPTILTRAGQRLYFKPADMKYAFLTEAGQLDLKPEDLAAIHTDTPEGGLHRAIFRNGSVLAGLLVQKDVKVTLDLGPTFTAPASSVSQFLFPGEPVDTAGLAEATVRNEDVLYGRLAQDVLEIKTRFGAVKVARADLAELRLAEGAMDRVDVKLHNGTTVSGQYADQKLRFQIEPGPEVSLFIGHVVKITCPKPKDTPKTAPTTGSATPPPASAAPVPPDGAERVGREKADDEAAHLRQEIDALQARADVTHKAMADTAAQAARLASLGKNDEAAGLLAKQKELKAMAAELEAQSAKLSAQLAKLTKGPRAAFRSSYLPETSPAERRTAEKTSATAPADEKARLTEDLLRLKLLREEAVFRATAHLTRAALLEKDKPEEAAADKAKSAKAQEEAEAIKAQIGDLEKKIALLPDAKKS